MIEKLGTEEVDFKRFMFLWQRVISSEDTRIRSYAMDMLFSKLDSENTRARSFTVSALKKALSHFIQGKMEFEFTYVKDRLYEKVKDHILPADILKDCSQLFKIIFFEMIQQKKFKEAKKILSEYKAHLSSEVDYPQEVRKVAQEFIREVSNKSTLATLISHMKEGTPLQTKRLVEEVLESLNGNRVAERLLDIFTVDDRASRMSALRVLSRLGRSSISILSAFLSDSGIFVREKGTALLVDEQWYKVRNSIYVLGNI